MRTTRTQSVSAAPRPRLTWRFDLLFLLMSSLVTHHVPSSIPLSTARSTDNQTNTATIPNIPTTPEELYAAQEVLKEHDWEWVLVQILQVSNLPLESMGTDWPDPQISLHMDADLPPSIYFSGPLQDYTWPTKWNSPTNSSDWEGLGLVSYLKGTARSMTVSIMEMNQVDQHYQVFHKRIFDLPELEQDWTHVTLTDNEIVMELSLRRSSEPLFTEKDHVDMQLTERLIPLENGELASLAHRTKKHHRKAVLYIAGRSDSFAHPHLMQLYFNEKGFDFYALDQRRSGRARRFLKNVYLGNDVHDFSILYEDVNLALEYIRAQKDYELVVAHCHSNGALVLFSYLLQRQKKRLLLLEKDEAAINRKDDFDGYVLNSPFLDWGHVGGSFNEFVLKNANLLMTPFGSDAIMEVYSHYGSLNDWWTKTWLLYRWNLAWKPIITNSMTLNYAHAVTALHYEILATSKEEDDDNQDSVLLGDKPTLVLSSLSDDILDHAETMALARKLHSHPTVKEFEWHCHDVTKSFTKELNQEANDAIGDWLDDLQVYHSVH